VNSNAVGAHTDMAMFLPSNEPSSIVVHEQDARWQGLFPHPEQSISALVQSILTQEGACGELSVVLSADAHMQHLNAQFRGQNKPTNVLSFPAEDDGMLGDIVLSYDTLSREAAQQNKTLHDHALHLLVHGVLHLLGYDHEEEAQAAAMEAREVALLSQYGISNPYETTT
jgi:probable rRNA maturation factor